MSICKLCSSIDKRLDRMKKAPRVSKTRTLTQSWWRFSRYELHDGYIRPARGAKLEEYTPWDLHARSRDTRQRHRQPPYQELATLLGEFHGALDYSGKFVPTAKAVEALLDWCQRYGLLGLLPHEAEMVTFRPRLVWLPAGSPPQPPAREPMWRQDGFVRVAGGWRVHSRFDSPSLDPALELLLLDWTREENELQKTDPCHETPTFQPPNDWPPPHVLIRDPEYRHLLDRPLDNWFRYFPDHSDQTQPTPRPLTSAFWQAYAEPLEGFLTAAALLKSAMEWFTNEPEKHGRFLETFPDVPTEREFPELSDIWPDDVFRGMLQGVSPSVVTTESGRKPEHRQLLVAHSLVGMFAAMFLTDLTQGLDVRTCEVCSKLFVSGAHAAKYCSETCRSRIIKARLRQNMAKARKLRSQGKSATVIAKQLGSKVGTVRGWIKDTPTKKRRKVKKISRRRA